MVRPFHIRDVSVVQRLSPLGRSLAFEAVAVDGVNPLREAMRAYMSPGQDDDIMLVRRGANGEEDAFCLMHLSQAKDVMRMGCAAMMYMAPDPNSDQRVEAWMELLEESARVAGEHGAGVLIAEAPESSGEAEALHGAGFAPLIHVDVLKLATVGDAIDAAGRVPGLREQDPKDDRDDALVRWLSQRLIPKPIQRPETAMDLTRALHHMEWGYLVMRDSEALGHLSISSGKRAFGLQTLFRPELEDVASQAIRCALAARCRKPQKPVYATVPSYQSWLLPGLDAIGFTHITSTVLMVRHLTAAVRQPVWSQPLAAAQTKKLAKSGDRVTTHD